MRSAAAGCVWLMPTLIRLVARRAFLFRRLSGTYLQAAAGDIVEVSPIEAVLLRAKRDADFAPPAPPAPPEPVAPPKPTRRYQRRDLTADPECSSSD